MTFRRKIALTLATAALISPAAVPAKDAPAPAPRVSYAPADFRQRLPEDEIIYFVLPDRFENGDPSNDRGGIKGDRLKTGYDPTSKGFYHGGDLKGLIKRLDYIQSLGATALWVGPIFKNKAVQGPPGDESAGYHGYWITDFTQVDPHLGTNADFKALVDAAHARGMKVYMDIIANHTADVIQYKECIGKPCPYRSKADYPYSTKGKPDGKAINPGFMGDDDASPDNWKELTDPNYAYTPFVPDAEKNIKVPAWLNNVIYYHNRGNTTFLNESSTMGDFVGLDDLMTENPRVVQGFIDIYGKWIDDFGIDGYRIDTARHVNPQFWQAFVPAMLKRAAAKGIPNFHIFGEVATDKLDPGYLATYTKVDKYPAVLDFAFKWAVIHALAGDGDTDGFEKLFAEDALYAGGKEAALRLPTFVGNHDQGRFAFYARKANPKASDEEILKRTELAHAMLLTMRGVPTIYSGSEQGFVGLDGDQAARQDMMPSKVASYNSEKLLGTTKTTADSNFDESHPLYREIAALAAIRKASPALRRGSTKLRKWGDRPGLLAVSRFDPDTGKETVLLYNTSADPVTGQVQVEVASTGFKSLIGPCAATVSAPGSLKVDLPAFGYAVCEAQ